MRARTKLLAPKLKKFGAVPFAVVVLNQPAMVIVSTYWSCAKKLGICIKSLLSFQVVHISYRGVFVEISINCTAVPW
jgi:hypothetical protein